MNYKHLLFVALIFLQSCAEPSTKNTTADNIKKVETSLINVVHIQGDSTWSIAERMTHYGVPGVSIAVINNGEIEWSKTYGVMDKESKAPVTENTLFQAASISKPVTAYGALTLVEQNKVDLNKDINTYLTSWKLPNNEFTIDKKVTLKNLLNHSAGTTVHGFLGYSPDLPVPTLIEVLNGTPPANSGAIFVDKIPEESYRYSGGGYNIIQQMMIDVEHKAFPDIMNALVLHPLEMNNSTFDQPLQGAQLGLAATGYLPDGSMTKGKRHTYPEMAPAGLWTTAEDLAKFAINIQQGLKGESQIGLSKEMVTKMLTPFVTDFTGLGIFLNKKKDQVYFGHGGWNEGFSSELIAHKDKGYGVVVLTNANQPAFISELIRAVALTYDWDAYVPVYKKMETDPAFIAEISGRYLINGNRLMEVVQSDKQLLGKELGEEPKELVKISDTTYVRRGRELLMQFKPNAANKTMDMLIIDPNNGAIVSTFTRMDDAKKIPLELLVEGDFDQALKAYQAVMKKDPKDPTINENNLNGLGYRFLNNDQMKLGQAVLKVNMMLYPDSFNVYDSYAEACMKMGESELAIENYKKSLRLNPENTNAVAFLKELQKEK